MSDPIDPADIAGFTNTIAYLVHKTGAQGKLRQQKSPMFYEELDYCLRLKACQLVRMIAYAQEQSQTNDGLHSRNLCFYHIVYKSAKFFFTIISMIVKPVNALPNSNLKNDFSGEDGLGSFRSFLSGTILK